MTELQAFPNTDPDLVEPAFEDYWGFSEVKEFVFPDGKQKIFYKIMNEGDRKKFQQKTRTDVILERQTGDARMKMSPADERHELIMASVTDWEMYRRENGKIVRVPFSGGSPGSTFAQWLQLADPRIIDRLEKDIRKANPWLLGEMTVADIDKEIGNLQEMREIAERREAGEGSSSGK